MIDLLLYSGGVESVLCLDWAVKQGIVPFLFHFRKLNYRGRGTVEKLVKRNAKLISPESPYYVYDTGTVEGFEAILNATHEDGELFPNVPKFPLHKFYGIRLADGMMYPLEHADHVIIGYSKYVYNVQKTVGRGRKLMQATFMELVERYDLPFIFPLAEFTRPQIDRMFKALPDQIKQNTVSSSRHYDFGGYGWID